jgi:hypothetical protein
VEEFYLLAPANLEQHFELVPKEFLKLFFQDEVLKDSTQLLEIMKEVGICLVYTEPIIAEKILNEAINLSKQSYSKYNPDLYSLHLHRARALMMFKDLDAAYESINLALINAIQNFPYDSFEIVEVLEAFGKFSLEIQEYGEYEIYCQKIDNILNKLEKTKNDTFSSLKIIYFKCSILDGLTSYYNHTYTIDQLKSFSTKYENLISSNLFIMFEKESSQLSEPEKFYILYNKIKLKAFFRKELQVSQILEMINLCREMSKLKKFELHLLIEPYIFLITQYAKNEDTTKLENFIFKEWVDLIELISKNNFIAANSHFLNLIRSLLFKEKFLNRRLSNLLDLTGENYRKLLEIKIKQEKIKKTYLYGELCYLGAIINRDNPTMHPWNLGLLAFEIFNDTLGENAEKTKKAKSLSEWIIKRHNIQLIENKQ